MTVEESTMIIEMFQAIPFFPTASGAQALIASELISMCKDSQQAVWLARRMSQLYGKWPGTREMRAVFCSKYPAQDGIECYSEIYLDGVPSERESSPLQIASAPVLALPEGHNVSADPELENMVTQIAESLSAPQKARHVRTPEEIRVDAELRQLYRIGDGQVRK